MDAFLQEYSSEESIRKYTKETAGYGISYLLEHDYGEIYIEVLRNHLRAAMPSVGIRLLEFGCGGGMNLIHLVSMLGGQGRPVEVAYGCDFSEKLIDAANLEAERYLPKGQQKKVRFCTARNECLIQDLSAGLGLEQSALLGTFHLILGVNTFRYCHRLGKGVDCARDIFNLLVKGGVCVIIDMNNKFPLFRSTIRDPSRRKKPECYIPTLEEYASPFTSVGFEILRKENFCWIPHSAGPWVCGLFAALSPLLNSLVPSYAMRSLVISRKPG